MTEKQIVDLICGTAAVVLVTGVIQLIDCSDNESNTGECYFCAAAVMVLGGAAGVAALAKNPAPAVVGAFVAAILGLVCAMGSLINWDSPPQPES